MTTRPLDFTFPLMSDLSKVAPHTIPVDEQLLEVELEEDYRLRTYPAQVKRGAMTEDGVNRHLVIWKQIRLDLTQPPADFPPLARQHYWQEWCDRRAASPVRWADKVRELRRELAMRRNFYPKQIQKGGDRAELGRRMERLEAVHFSYWISMDYLDPIAEPKDQGRDRLRRFMARRDRWIVDAWQAGDRALAGHTYARELNRQYHAIGAALTLLRFPPAPLASAA